MSKKHFSQTSRPVSMPKQCEVTDAAVDVIVDNLKIVASDLEERFSDLKQIDFQTWVMQSMLVNISDALMQYQVEILEMQNEETKKNVFNIKGVIV